MNLHFNKDSAAERFIRYAEIFTQSKDGVADTPSTDCQRDLAKLLYEELKDMGADEVCYDEDKCYVYATLHGNIPADTEKVNARKDAAAKRRENLAPIIGLIAHMDTSDAVDGKDHGVHPRLISEYDGKEIVLNEEAGISMGPDKFPVLSEKKGQTLVVTDGLSVLGGDDKAGIVQIMEVLDFFIKNPQIPHGTIRVMFTPDEETGNGVLNADLEKFAVDYGYTIDGSQINVMEYENFNAASCHVEIKGKSTHPGNAKDAMINALLVAMDFNSLIPEKEIPSCTEGYEGFYHLEEMKGVTDHAEMDYIIRDHDMEKFEARKEKMAEIAEKVNSRYGDGTVVITVKDSYYNMAEKVKPHMHLVDNACRSMEELGLTPVICPIRGGTDGCQLSFRGIPCPNLGTGAYNYHSRYEFVVAQEMAMGAEVVTRTLNKYAAYELNDQI